MANDNVTSEDLKATAKAQAKALKTAIAEKAATAADSANETAASAQATVEDAVETTVERVNNFSTNQKLLIVSGLTLLGSVVIQKLLERFRQPEIVIEEQNVTVLAAE